MARSSSVERIGHRGAPLERKENTLASFQRAVELGADAVELDVHVTRDGIPVVHHDATLGRVTPGTLSKAALSDLTAAEVGSIQLESGDPIPRLQDVLRILTPRTKVYVEIKRGSVPATARVVEQFRDSIAVHSFDHDAIEELSRLAPGIVRGVLIEHRSEDVAAIVRRTGATDVWPAWKLVDAAFMDTARSLKTRVIPWTVNATEDCRRLAALGVSGICTNDLPALERALENEKRPVV
jgi:glycerophosphoryl diester phosphodiesterase